MRGTPHPGGGSRLGLLWERFPKFVLGFLAASLVFSFLLDPKLAKDLDKPLKGLREVWFAAAFVRAVRTASGSMSMPTTSPAPSRAAAMANIPEPQP